VNLTFFAPWLPWQWPPFRIFATPQKESKNLLNPPFIVSMANAAKFVILIPIFG
jgi:hypothetical protein